MLHITETVFCDSWLWMFTLNLIQQNKNNFKQDNAEKFVIFASGNREIKILCQSSLHYNCSLSGNYWSCRWIEFPLQSTPTPFFSWMDVFTEVLFLCKNFCEKLTSDIIVLLTLMICTCMYRLSATSMYHRYVWQTWKIWENDCWSVYKLSLRNLLVVDIFFFLNNY